MLTFGNSATLLRQHGYAPVACGEDGRPIGPFAVQQTNFFRSPSSEPLPVAVLTATPAPRFDADPVQDHKATWLATLTVKVSDKLAADAAAIMAKLIGAAVCPVLVENGVRRYVLRLTGPQFPMAQTSPVGDADDSVSVQTGPSFLPLNATWEGPGLLDVPRAELPEIDKQKAAALIKAVDALLEAHAPVPVPEPPRRRRPILEPGARLLFGNHRALHALGENGFKKTVPVRWRHQQEEKDGYLDYINTFQYNVAIDNHGVGIFLDGLVAVESMYGRHDIDPMIRAMGRCLVRSVEGGKSLYLFRSGGGRNQDIQTPFVGVQLRRSGLIVLSGADAAGNEYTWDRDILQARVAELSTLEEYDSRLERALQALPEPDYSKPAPKRRKAVA